MQELARFDIELHPVQTGATRWVWQGEHHIADVSDARIQELAKRIDPDLAHIHERAWITEGNQHLDQPFRDYLRQLETSEETREAFLAWTGTLTGADPSEFSALGILRDFKMFGSARTALEAGECRISGGTQRLASAMAAELDSRILYNKRVAGVSRKQTGFEVATTDNSTIDAQAVIVAVPFNTLHGLNLPALAGEQIKHESQRGHANRSAKLWFDARSPFDARISATPTALAFMDATQTAGCIIAAEDLSVELATQALLLPEAALSRPRVHSWLADVNAQGAWMTIRPGQAAILDRIWALGQQYPDFQIVSGDVSPIWPGWMEGALYAGYTAAERLIAMT
jgi:monoamine oxidase